MQYPAIRQCLSASITRLVATKAFALLPVLLLLTLAEQSQAGVLAPGTILVADTRALGGDGAIIAIDPVTHQQSLIASGGLLVHPNGLTTDASGSILLPTFDFDPFQPQQGRVLRVDPMTGQQTVVAFGGLIGQPLGGEPTGIALEASGKILVTEEHGFSTSEPISAIVRIDPVTAAEARVTAGGFLVNPARMAIDSLGRIVVADENALGGSGAIIRVDPITGNQQIVSSGPFLNAPHGIVIDPLSGDYFVADFGESVPGAVFRVDHITGAATAISQGGLFVDPFDIAMGGDGFLYVADLNAFGGSGGVIRVDPSNGAQQVISSGGFFVDPAGITIVSGAAPEPSSVVLVSLGLSSILLVFRPRRGL